MVQFLSINFFFFLGFLQFLWGFSKVPVFFCVTMYTLVFTQIIFYVWGQGSVVLIVIR